ncbi:choice-of-anchor L domain-containing protein [Novosphingobium sp. KCTC 2891]|uniref:choice-of-anchor L domain-containing protein n=1 Tax=Novosphingobium sp. KCTC 2891 TaxID=2989730 RepID=UPI0022237ECA|nr:choice-of-anchor L domain-containing protein [Novosphingobium sp. KCTC 2891]MCW1382529.1 choice-of-anchor L domain-containing protein [Novosphingobium sp. KCTC 2891]
MTSTPFTVWSGTNLGGLVDTFLGTNSGISVDTGSITLSASGADAVNLYDGSLTALGIGSGLLLTSGTTPGTVNTVSWFGQDNTVYAADGTATNFNNGNPLIDSVVNTVFQTQSYDATTLSFNFTVSDPAATSVSFDLVFGSDEYPEWVDQFVDCAVIVVNGVNYALFNHDPKAPLSVIGPNLAAGYFQDNAGNVLPIEYDGVSHVLKIVAPINAGQVNSITIGIADTGDHVYDSGLVISNMTAGTTPGSGVVLTPNVPATEGNDVVTGSVADELISLLGGDDIAYAGGGDDIVVAGAGNDKVYGGSGNDTLEGDGGNDLLDGGDGTANVAVYAGKSTDFTVSIDAATGHVSVTDHGSDSNDEGTDTLVAVQQIRFSDGLFDVTAGGLVAHVDGGTIIDTPGMVTLAGVALPGHALTAIVTDPDGLPADPAAVAYQWLVSSDGVNWTDTGMTGKTFALSEGDAGKQVMATASYVDGLGTSEFVASGALAVAAPTGGLAIELMTLATPAGGSVADPLTTLLKNAADLGFTPATAEIAIKAALGLPDVDLRTYDPYAALVANPTDAVAVKVMQVAAQVAMAASISDPTGYNLALAVIGAADKGQVLNLADKATLDTLLAGTDASLLSIVEGLNKDMGDTHSLSAIKLVWNDYCGQTDQLSPYIGHLETLSVHINQAPVGFSAAALADGVQDVPYTILASDLLAGFADPEGSTLAIAALSADTGTLVDNLDGTYTFVPAPGYSGPVELAFTVSDPEGATKAGSTMLIIDAAPAGDTAPPVATLTSDSTGIANGAIGFTLSFSEDVTGVDASAFAVTNGTIVSVSGTGSTFAVVVAPAAGIEGDVTLALGAGTVTDLAGNANGAGAAATQAVDTLAPDAAISYVGPAIATGPVSYAVTFTEAVTGLEASDFVAVNGTVTSVNGTGTAWIVTVTPDADVEGKLSLALPSGAVSDLAGNAGTGAVALPVKVDTRAPTVTSFSPADGAAAVATTANIVATFSEAIAAGSGTIALHLDTPGGAIVETFDAATSGRLQFSGSTLIIDPVATLAEGTHYYVTFSAGSVTDTAGNAFAGTSSYDFTTVAPQPLVLVGTAGVDVLVGGALDDSLNGLALIDKLDGRGGSDTYVIGLAGDHLGAEINDTSTSGTDTVSFTATTASTLTLFAGDTGLEVASVAAGTVALSINASLVQNGLSLIGNAGANTLTGTAFADVLMGGAGNDVLAGGNGIDTASYADMTGAVTVSLALTKAQATGAAGSDTLTSIENLIGGSGNDVLTGNTAANRIDGGAGADSIDGGSGNDALLGGAGADTLVGGAGADSLTGGAGADLFVFKATSESGVTANDAILDFSRTDGDRIDLRLIDAVAGGKDNAFAFVSAFTHVAGQLAASVSGDHYLVQGDLNGDAVADFAIAVWSTAPLGAADFVL